MSVCLVFSSNLFFLAVLLAQLMICSMFLFLTFSDAKEIAQLVMKLTNFGIEMITQMELLLTILCSILPGLRPLLDLLCGQQSTLRMSTISYPPPMQGASRFHFHIPSSDRDVSNSSQSSDTLGVVRQSTMNWQPGQSRRGERLGPTSHQNRQRERSHRYEEAGSISTVPITPTHAGFDFGFALRGANARRDKGGRQASPYHEALDLPILRPNHSRGTTDSSTTAVSSTFSFASALKRKSISFDNDTKCPDDKGHNDLAYSKRDLTPQAPGSIKIHPPIISNHQEKEQTIELELSQNGNEDTRTPITPSSALLPAQPRNFRSNALVAETSNPHCISTTLPDIEYTKIELLPFTQPKFTQPSYGERKSNTKSSISPASQVQNHNDSISHVNTHMKSCERRNSYQKKERVDSSETSPCTRADMNNTEVTVLPAQHPSIRTEQINDQQPPSAARGRASLISVTSPSRSSRPRKRASSNRSTNLKALVPAPLQLKSRDSTNGDSIGSFSMVEIIENRQRDKMSQKTLRDAHESLEVSSSQYTSHAKLPTSPEKRPCPATDRPNTCPRSNTTEAVVMRTLGSPFQPQFDRKHVNNTTPPLPPPASPVLNSLDLYSSRSPYQAPISSTPSLGPHHCQDGNSPPRPNTSPAHPGVATASQYMYNISTAVARHPGVASPRRLGVSKSGGNLRRHYTGAIGVARLVSVVNTGESRRGSLVDIPPPGGRRGSAASRSSEGKPGMRTPPKTFTREERSKTMEHILSRNRLYNSNFSSKQGQQQHVPVSLDDIVENSRVPRRLSSAKGTAKTGSNKERSVQSDSSSSKLRPSSSLVPPPLALNPPPSRPIIRTQAQRTRKKRPSRQHFHSYSDTESSPTCSSGGLDLISARANLRGLSLHEFGSTNICNRQKESVAAPSQQATATQHENPSSTSPWSYNRVGPNPESTDAD